MRIQSVLTRGLPLLVFASALSFFAEYRTDDTYIYLQFARNLAGGDGFSFNPNEPTFGVTSWAWTWLLASGIKLGLDPLDSAKIWGVVLSIAAVASVHACALQLLRHSRTALLATLVWVLHAWNVRWTLSGLETPLMMLCLAQGWFWSIRAERSRAAHWGSGFWWGLAVLARPEAIGLVLLAAFRELLCQPGSPSPRSRGVLLSLLAPGVLLLGSVMLWAQFQFGNPLPNTIAAKGVDGGMLAILNVLFAELRIGLATDAVFLFLALIFVVQKARSSRENGAGKELAVFGSSVWFAPVVWSVAVCLLYALTRSVIVSRYLVPGSLVVVMVGFAIAEEFAEKYTRSSWPTAYAVPVTFAVAILLNLAVLKEWVLPHTREFPVQWDQSVGSIADWLHENTPPDATVGAIDIGLLAYRSNRRVIDLYGLTYPELIPLRKNLHIADFVKQLKFSAVTQPDYLMDRQLAPNRLAEIDYPNVHLEPILHREVKALGIRRSNRYYYTLYRLEWGEPS